MIHRSMPTLIVFAAMIIFNMGAGTFSQASAADQVLRSGDWSVFCDDKKKQSKDSCYLSYVQKLKDKKTGNVVGTTISVFVRANRGSATKTINITGPLGIDLTQGIIVGIDEKNRQSLKVNQCTKAGCAAAANADEAFVDLMKAGKALSVYVLPFGAAKAVKFEASLSGFTKAVNTINSMK